MPPAIQLPSWRTLPPAGGAPRCGIKSAAIAMQSWTFLLGYAGVKAADRARGSPTALAPSPSLARPMSWPAQTERSLLSGAARGPVRGDLHAPWRPAGQVGPAWSRGRRSCRPGGPEAVLPHACSWWCRSARAGRGPRAKRHRPCSASRASRSIQVRAPGVTHHCGTSPVRPLVALPACWVERHEEGRSPHWSACGSCRNYVPPRGRSAPPCRRGAPLRYSSSRASARALSRAASGARSDFPGRGLKRAT